MTLSELKLKISYLKIGSYIHKKLDNKEGSWYFRIFEFYLKPITSLPLNNANFEVASHISWESGSAYFAGPIDTINSIQFPSIAMPIASAIGIMFIATTRKGKSKNSNYIWSKK